MTSKDSYYLHRFMIDHKTMGIGHTYRKHLQHQWYGQKLLQLQHRQLDSLAKQHRFKEHAAILRQKQAYQTQIMP